MRLIDADVIEKFLDDFADSCGNHQKAVLREVKYALGHMPTIEAVPTEFHDKCQQIEIQKRLKLEEDYRSMERTVEKLTKALADTYSVGHNTNDTIATVESNEDKLRSMLHDCRNELCLNCGLYKSAYQGACDNCRWASGKEWDKI